MPIPPQYPDFNHWMSATLGALSKSNIRYGVHEADWAILNATQHTLAKTEAGNDINAAIAELQAMVTYINSVPS